MDNAYKDRYLHDTSLLRLPFEGRFRIFSFMLDFKLTKHDRFSLHRGAWR